MKWMQRVPNVDAAWLRMDRPNNPMMITGVIRLQGPVRWGRMEALIRGRLWNLYPRFRWLIGHRGPFGVPWWVEPDEPAMTKHIVRVCLEGGADAERAFIDQMLSTPLDPTEHVWQFHFVDLPDGSGLMLLRIHHVVADGMSLAQLFLELGDADLSERQGRTPEAMQVGSGFRERLKLVGRSTAELARLVTLPGEPDLGLKVPLGEAKSAVFLQPIPLDEVKAVARREGGTVNDVVLSVVAAGVRRHLLEAGVKPRPLRTFVPFNLRPVDPEVRYELGNRFGLVLSHLPVDATSWTERIRRIRKSMKRIKRGVQPLATYGALQLTGLTPLPLEKLVMALFGPKATLIVTNVPGPTRHLQMADHKVEDVMFWVPQSANLGFGVSILSYAGMVRIGIAVDKGCVPEPDAMAGHFHDAWLALKAGEAA